MYIQYPDVKNSTKVKLLSFYALSLIVFGFLVDSPIKILKGIYNILIEPGTLITDYIGIGGIGAAFVHTGILTLIFIFILHKLNIQFNGATFASLWLITGFSLFGKNILNVWFIVIGVYIYAKIQRESFSKYIYIALFGTAMAPMVTEIFFSTTHAIWMRILLGTLIGIVIGVILPPLSSYLIRVHQGFNLYNIGFTAGMIGTVLVSIFKSYGYKPMPKMIWTDGNNSVLGVYLYVLFLSMIILAWYLDPKAFKKMKNIMKYSGRLVTDFIMLEGFCPTLMNMGILGLIATTYVLGVGGDLNGPTIGCIFTIVGFGAFGKHPRNVLPIFLGVGIGALTKVFSIQDPAILLAALCGTALAPIAGEFGWIYGMIAAFIHSSVVLNVGVLHGGLNLYNNGFSAGIVAAIMVPIIEAFRKDDQE